ncbi:hypothetical protein GA0070624_5791 [Micromonospora rhizosphaerae]|uniref:Uncharacterized protein n=1 Tax=Micromonospora rhizosphaerae TaxID=568872 RepID=A0A1C6T6R2_9ACTN|nr:hypothetical protein [Micromonospora rhizosphaerae]SCL37203.1 hypothetical protein GA0070624_5791 [Micromonospora rhizosphaerae]
MQGYLSQPSPASVTTGASSRTRSTATPIDSGISQDLAEIGSTSWSSDSAELTEPFEIKLPIAEITP